MHNRWGDLRFCALEPAPREPRARDQQESRHADEEDQPPDREYADAQHPAEREAGEDPFENDDADERAFEVYGALVRKLINWLTVKTGEGDLYEIDTALRPNGNSGLLVTSFTAYANYQQQRGSNTAWTWEHQAMTRARCVLGST